MPGAGYNLRSGKTLAGARGDSLSRRRKRKRQQNTGGDQKLLIVETEQLH